MDTNNISKLLEQVAAHEMDVSSAMQQLKNLPYEDIGFANIDHHRSIRTGQAEVIFGQGKTPEQIAGIISHMLEANHTILVTRADEKDYEAVLKVAEHAQYHELARIITVGEKPQPKADCGRIGIVTAGTSDIPVSEEAALTAEYFGYEVERFYDVGVAGIHRLFGKLDRIKQADVLIVIAGMEGALASVVGGLVSVPVIAVPTSVGYGANFGGFAALLSMLNSCANGIGVVNIDNGYGAACLATKILSGEHMKSHSHIHHEHNHQECDHTEEDVCFHTHVPGSGHMHSHSPEHTVRLRNRLAKAIGHLERVKCMIEDERDCCDVLMQLAAVKSALNNTGKYILKEHMSHCMVEAVENNDTSEIEDLQKVIDYFMK